MNQIERCRPWLEPSLDARNTWGEVVDDLVNNRAMLWPGERSALVTQIVGRSIHVWLGGGSLAELLQLRVGVEAIGRLMGCEHITGSGRKGWIRALRNVGYESHGTELRKRL